MYGICRCVDVSGCVVLGVAGGVQIESVSIQGSLLGSESEYYKSDIGLSNMCDLLAPTD